MSRLTTLFLGSASLFLNSYRAQADHLSAKFLFAGRLNGAQEVPAVNTSALGVASLTMSSSGDTLCLTMTANGLSGPITGVHIHDGKPGVAGPVVKDLMPYLSGNSLQAKLTGASLSGLSVAKLFAGDYYVNVHTAANTSGEIRGQALRSLCTILPVSTDIQRPGGLPQGISIQPNPTTGTTALLPCSSAARKGRKCRSPTSAAA